MAQPRKALISLDDTQPTTTSPHAAYPKHFVGQALRGAFLCGKDSYSD